MIALGRALVARGHAVTLQTWAHWREHVEREGMGFAPAPEYQVVPVRDGEPAGLKPYQAVVRATGETAELIDTCRADVVVADILTLAPALAAELRGVPLATLIPHIYPVGDPSLPPYATGARLGRVPWWRVLAGPLENGLVRGREQLNGTRRRLGLPEISRFHGGQSEELVVVGTFPQLEYPRDWPAHVKVVGPLMWEPPFGHTEPPAGDDPLVLVAPSTAHDAEQQMLAAALRGLAGERVRVLATWNRRPPPRPLDVPPNARLVEWVSYSDTMPPADVVVGHAGHGTATRALSQGCRMVVVPASGDMYENAARLDWAGVGVRLPMRLLSPAALRLAVRRALDLDPRPVHAIQTWSAAHDGPTRAAELVEAL